MSTLEQNKRVVHQYADAFNAGDWETLRRLFAPEPFIAGVLGSGGFETALGVWKELHSAFGLQWKIESLVADGDQVAVRCTECGTFVAPFRGQAPTGNSYEIVAMEWFTLKDGRIQSRWGARDLAAILRQRGV